MGPVLQAFRTLIQQLLTESEESVAAWRRLLQAAGWTGRLSDAARFRELVSRSQRALARKPRSTGGTCSPDYPNRSTSGHC